MRVLFLLFSLVVTANAQWTVQQSHTTASLRGIHSIGNGIAWASGTEGTILRTTDSGQTWQTCTVPPAAEHLDFRGVQAFDAETAVVMSSGKGDLSRLYKTSDACKTWKLLFTNPDPEGFWDALSATPGLYWILGDPTGGHFNVMTFDPSAKQPRPDHADLCLSSGADRAHYQDTLHHDCASGLAARAPDQSAFAASNSAFFELSHAFRSYFGPPPLPGENIQEHLHWVPTRSFVTGGTAGARICTRQEFSGGDYVKPLQWECQALPLGSASVSSGAFSLSFRTAEIGVAVGGDFAAPTHSERTAVYRASSESGWRPALTPPHGYRSSVDYDSQSKTWITVGPNGTDISRDDGRNWQAVHPSEAEQPDADKNWNALSLPFVVGPHGRIGILTPAP